MPPNVAYLQGGPCNGTTRTGFDEVNPPPSFTCKGNEYDYQPGHARPNGDLIYLYQGPVGGGGSGVKAARAHGGWGSLRTSLNKHMPAGIKSAERNTSAALRELRRASRVIR